MHTSFVHATSLLATPRALFVFSSHLLYFPMKWKTLNWIPFLKIVNAQWTWYVWHSHLQLTFHVRNKLVKYAQTHTHYKYRKYKRISKREFIIATAKRSHASTFMNSYDEILPTYNSTIFTWPTVVAVVVLTDTVLNNMNLK